MPCAWNWGCRWFAGTAEGRMSTGAVGCWPGGGSQGSGAAIIGLAVCGYEPNLPGGCPGAGSSDLRSCGRHAPARRLHDRRVLEPTRLSATRGDCAAADKRAACRHVATSGSLVGFSPTVAESHKKGLSLLFLVGILSVPSVLSVVEC